ncbi:hypothetical protein D3C73_821490 [compost metagenome]
MVVIPQGLLLDRRLVDGESKNAPTGFSDDPEARRKIELAAMAAVMAAERALGNEPSDVSAQKIGYDIQSYDPKTDHIRFIEVKGRVEGADSVMVTRQEVITSLNKPDQFILGIVHVDNGFAREPLYVRGALQTHEPSFDVTAIQFNLKSLLERAEIPA